MDLDPDRFAALLAARLAAVVPDGFQVTLEGDMLWFRSDEGRFPGQQGDYQAGSAGLWPQADLLTCLGCDGTASDGTASDGTASDGTVSDGTAPGGTASDDTKFGCAADAARHALDALQDYVAEATHDPWPGQRTMPEPHAQVRGTALHLWYGDADAPVLACEPISLADLARA